MVDPINFTNFSRSDYELEEVLLFSILVAGKNALTTSKLLDNFIKQHNHKMPFDVFRKFEKIPELAEALKKAGFGCYNSKAKGIYQLVRAGYDLRKCSIDDLEKINGIGMKTSRLFILHTRKDADCIPLDVHILHYLRDLGYNSIPVATPSSKKKYLVIENICKDIARKVGLTMAEWDLTTWKIYRDRAAHRKAS